MKTFVECIHGNKVEFDTNEYVGDANRFSENFTNCCGITLEKRIRFYNDYHSVFIHSFQKNKNKIIILTNHNDGILIQKNIYDIYIPNGNNTKFLTLEDLDTPQKQFDALYKVYSNLEFL